MTWTRMGACVALALAGCGGAGSAPIGPAVTVEEAGDSRAAPPEERVLGRGLLDRLDKDGGILVDVDEDDVVFRIEEWDVADRTTLRSRSGDQFGALELADGMHFPILIAVRPSAASNACSSPNPPVGCPGNACATSCRTRGGVVVCRADCECGAAPRHDVVCQTYFEPGYNLRPCPKDSLDPCAPTPPDDDFSAPPHDPNNPPGSELPGGGAPNDPTGGPHGPGDPAPGREGPPNPNDPGSGAGGGDGTGSGRQGGSGGAGGDRESGGGSSGGSGGSSGGGGGDYGGGGGGGDYGGGGGGGGGF